MNRNRRLAGLLSFILLFSVLIPYSFAEKAAGEEVPSEEIVSSEDLEDENIPKEDGSIEEVSEEEISDEPSESGVTSDNFIDLQDLSDEEKQIFDALFQAGILDGLTEDWFGLDERMTRAQFAKAAAYIFSLEVDKTLTESTFDDVHADDPSNSYAIPYIEALRQAELTNGYDSEGKLFNPSGEVSREELAVFLIRGLQLEEEAKAADGVPDPTVSDWAQPYVSLAMEKNILPRPDNGQFEGTLPATRKILALASYEAMKLHQEANRPPEVSITEVKVIGASKITVMLNREIEDVDNAYVVVHKEGEEEEKDGFIEWQEDHKTATFTFDEPLTKGTYEVELAGLEDELAEESNAEWTVEDDERLEKLELIADSRTLPRARASIGFKATNQYGEEMKLSAGQLLIEVTTANRTAALNLGNSTITLDLSEEFPNTSITVTLIESTGFQAASKTFIVGDDAIVSKFKVDEELQFTGDQSLLKAGGKAYLGFEAYDQYGNRIIDPRVLNQGIHRTFIEPNVLIEHTGPYDFVDIDEDGYPELQFAAHWNLIADKEVTVYLNAAGQTAALKIQVIAPKMPASVEFVGFKDKLANGDGESFIELAVKDSSGYSLTPEEIIDAETTGKLMIYSSGGIMLEADPPERLDTSVTPNQLRKAVIQSSGGDKGKIRIKEVKGEGHAAIHVQLTSLSEAVTLPIDIKPARKPSTIQLDGDTRSYLLLPGTSAGPKFKIMDQYGSEYKKKREDYTVEFKLERISGELGAVSGTTGAVQLSDSNPVESKGLDISSKEIKFVADLERNGSYQLTATLMELAPNGMIRALGSASATADIVDQAKVDLIYELDLSDTISAAGRLLYDGGKTTSVTGATYLITEHSVFTKSIEIRAKDSSDNSVKLPGNPIRGISSNNPKVIGHNKLDKVIGLDSGTAEVTVYFETPAGMKKLSKDVTVVAESLFVQELKAGRTDYTVSDGAFLSLDGLYIWDGKLMNQLQAIDQYGNKFTSKPNTNEIAIYNDLLDVQAFIGNIVYMEPDPARQDIITVDSDFKIHYTRRGDPSFNNIKQFTIYVGAANQLKPTLITLQP